MQQNIPGSRLGENQENMAETVIILLYKQVQNYMQMISNMTQQYMGMKQNDGDQAQTRIKVIDITDQKILSTQHGISTLQTWNTWNESRHDKDQKSYIACINRTYG